MVHSLQSGLQSEHFSGHDVLVESSTLVGNARVKMQKPQGIFGFQRNFGQPFFNQCRSVFLDHGNPTYLGSHFADYFRCVQRHLKRAALAGHRFRWAKHRKDHWTIAERVVSRQSLPCSFGSVHFHSSETREHHPWFPHGK